MKNLAPQVGLEPTTLRLTAGCSAIELLRSMSKADEEMAALIVLFKITSNGPVSNWRFTLNCPFRAANSAPKRNKIRHQTQRVLFMLGSTWRKSRRTARHPVDIGE